MSWLEVIHLRTSGASLEALARQVIASIKADEAGLRVVSVYRRSALRTDIAVHIHHHQGSKKSALGQHLSSSLRDYGVVEHTVWEKLAGGAE